MSRFLLCAMAICLWYELGLSWWDWWIALREICQAAVLSWSIQLYRLNHMCCTDRHMQWCHWLSKFRWWDVLFSTYPRLCATLFCNPSTNKRGSFLHEKCKGAKVDQKYSLTFHSKWSTCSSPFFCLRYIIFQWGSLEGNHKIRIVCLTKVISLCSNWWLLLDQPQLKKDRLRFLINWVLTDLASCIASILKWIHWKWNPALWLYISFWWPTNLYLWVTLVK